MAYYTLAIIFTFFAFVKLGNCIICDEPWVLFKDEKCVQLFPSELKTYAEAEAFCQTQAPENLRPSLLFIKSAEFQTFIDLTVYANPETFDSIWVGAFFNDTTGNFSWSDGELLSYTNWAPGFPREPTNPDVCVELRSPNSKSNAYWYDVACGKRNMVVCQKSTTWTIDEVVYEFIKLRKAVEEL